MVRLKNSTVMKDEEGDEMLQGPGVNVNWVPGMTLDEMEKNCILAAIRFYRGNKTQTAQALGISIRTLDHKIERYEADAREQQQRAEDRKRNDAATLERLRGKKLTEQFGIGSSSQWARDGRNADDGIGEATADKEGGETSEAPSGATPTGVSMEPSSDIGAKPTVPMSQRGEVQKVLPRQAAAGSARRRS